MGSLQTADAAFSALGILMYHTIWKTTSYRRILLWTTLIGLVFGLFVSESFI